MRQNVSSRCRQQQALFWVQHRVASGWPGVSARRVLFFCNTSRVRSSGYSTGSQVVCREFQRVALCFPRPDPLVLLSGVPAYGSGPPARRRHADSSGADAGLGGRTGLPSNWLVVSADKLRGGPEEPERGMDQGPCLSAVGPLSWRSRRRIGPAGVR